MSLGAGGMMDQHLELPQSELITEHYLKHEPGLDQKALLLDDTVTVAVKIKRESEPDYSLLQLQDIALTVDYEQRQMFEGTLLGTPNGSFTVDVQVKRESELGPELMQPQDIKLPADPEGKDETMFEKKPYQITNEDGREIDWSSDTDMSAERARALRQLAAGCCVKLRRLRVLECDICGEMFHTRSRLVAHFIDQHAGDDSDSHESDDENRPPELTTTLADTSDNLKLYPCNICHEQFAFQCNMRIHKLKHWGREPLTCDICEKDFARKANLLTHMRTHFKQRCLGEPSSCEICGKLFTDQFKLRNHLYYHNNKSLKRFACEICGTRFISKSHLISHRTIHTGEKPYSCVICKKLFALKMYLTCHYRTHAADKRYICQTCMKKPCDCSSFAHRKYNYNSVYTCDICKKQFTHKSNLRKHIATHSGETPFVCEVCKRPYTKRSHLKDHMKLHTDAYVCEVCKRPFMRNSHLVEHMRIHTGEKPYECEICGRRFRIKTDLVTHNRTHTGKQPFTCDICKKTFNRKSNLTNHYRTHSGEKPYMCDICKKTFRQKSDLRIHIRMHTGEKPYACDICKKTFGHKSNLKVHKKVNHTGKKDSNVKRKKKHV